MQTSHGIMIIDDHAMFRAGIRALLETQDNLEIIAEASDGLDGLHQATRLNPQLIITDLSMPNLNGTEAIAAIKRRIPEAKILVLTVHKVEEYIHAALRAGADGYILKDDSQDDLITAIQQVLAGKTYLSPSICKNVVHGYLNPASSSQSDLKPCREMLTMREMQVLKLIAEGNRNKQIAALLSISTKTVEKHRSNLMKKLDLHDISSITTYAIKNGIVLTA
ncbi:MAG: response regulator [Gammaproteobacteria bacterium]|nr:response regulator [Gammaproteobacteria bacterium]